MKVRSLPRMSINKLAEYLEAGAWRRKRILREQKFPNEVVILYYKAALDAIVAYTNSGFDEEIATAQFDEIGDKPADTVRQVKRLRDCLEAFEFYKDLVETEFAEEIQKYTIMPAPKNDSSILSLSGVDVSLRPDVYLTDQKKKQSGLIKFYISRHQPLSTKGANALTCLCAKYLEGKPIQGFRPNKAMVYVVDVFAKQVFSAPKSSAKILKDIEAACDEIKILWPQIDDHS